MSGYQGSSTNSVGSYLAAAAAAAAAAQATASASANTSLAPPQPAPSPKQEKVEREEEKPLDLSVKENGVANPRSNSADQASPKCSAAAAIAAAAAAANGAKKAYSQQDLEAAVQDIIHGRLGTRRASVVYGIPRSTLRNKVYKLEATDEGPSNRKSRMGDSASLNGSSNDGTDPPSPASLPELSLWRDAMPHLANIVDQVQSQALASYFNARQSGPLHLTLPTMAAPSAQVREAIRRAVCLAVSECVTDSVPYEGASTPMSTPTPGSLVPGSTPPILKDDALSPYHGVAFDLDDTSPEPLNHNRNIVVNPGSAVGGDLPTQVVPQKRSYRYHHDPKRPRPKRGQYRRYDKAALAEAVKSVRAGEMSVHRAGSFYGVPHSTLEYKVKERNLMKRAVKKTLPPTEPRASPKEEGSQKATVEDQDQGQPNGDSSSPHGAEENRSQEPKKPQDPPAVQNGRTPAVTTPGVITHANGRPYWDDSKDFGQWSTGFGNFFQNSDMMRHLQEQASQQP